MDILNFILEPLQYAFMFKAVAVSTVVGIACAILSCFLVLKGWSLLGDAISHAVLPGVVLAYMLGIPFGLGAFVFAMLAVTMIGYIKNNTKITVSTSPEIIVPATDSNGFFIATSPL